MAEINDKLKKLLQEVGEIVDVKDRNSAVWSLPQNRNALIVKHKALEKVSAHLGMWFDPPTMIENNTEKGIVALSVLATLDHFASLWRQFPEQSVSAIQAVPRSDVGRCQKFPL